MAPPLPLISVPNLPSVSVDLVTGRIASQSTIGPPPVLQRSKRYMDSQPSDTISLVVKKVKVEPPTCKDMFAGSNQDHSNQSSSSSREPMSPLRKVLHNRTRPIAAKKVTSKSTARYPLATKQPVKQEDKPAKTNGIKPCPLQSEEILKLSRQTWCLDTIQQLKESVQTMYRVPAIAECLTTDGSMDSLVRASLLMLESCFQMLTQRIAQGGGVDTSNNQVSSSTMLTPTVSPSEDLSKTGRTTILSLLRSNAGQFSSAQQQLSSQVNTSQKRSGTTLKPWKLFEDDLNSPFFVKDLDLPSPQTPPRPWLTAEDRLLGLSPNSDMLYN